MHSNIATTKMTIWFAFTHQLCKAPRIALKMKMNVQLNHKQLRLLFVAPVHLTIQNKQRITEFILILDSESQPFFFTCTFFSAQPGNADNKRTRISVCLSSSAKVSTDYFKETIAAITTLKFQVSALIYETLLK